MHACLRMFLPIPLRMGVRRLRAAVALAATALTACSAADHQVVATQQVGVTGSPRDAARWYALSAERFAALPEAQQAIAFSTLDHNLLAAAIHHATNLQRAKHGLAALEYDAAVSEAARLQAVVMATKKFMGHENPFDASLRTPLDRLLKVGLKPRFLAENVAMEFLRTLAPGEAYYTRIEKGATVFSTTPNGPPIPMHSYVSFAAMVLNGWMDSPSHRANILSDQPRRLGCAGAPAQDSSGLEVLYCAQVFFTPMREASSAAIEPVQGR